MNLRSILLCLSGVLTAGVPWCAAAKPLESQRIDTLMAAAWAKDKVSPQPMIDDATFIRRVFLDVVGRIPTGAEVTTFLSDSNPEKRAALIDSLLASDGYVSHWFNYWADLLRLNPDTAGGNTRTGIEAYAHYLRDSLMTNKPYDKMVREMLTTDGFVWEHEGTDAAGHSGSAGANGYYIRDTGMALDNLSNTVQIFLGTRIVCAQCHNHPFDKWTQMDYYQMAAFTYGMKTNVQPDFYNKIRQGLRDQARVQVVAEMAEEEKKAALAPVIAPPVVATVPGPEDQSPAAKEARHQAKKVAEKAEEKARNDARQREGQLRNRVEKEVAQKQKKFARAFQPIANMVRGVTTEATAEMPKLPHDYQYANGKPHEVVQPKPMFGPSVSLGEKASPVEAFASWMTSPENPRFATVMANRLWKKVMGVALIEPVDEFLDSTQASHPEVMKVLEDTFRAQKYDLKAYLRILLNSDLYQRSTTTHDIDPGQRYTFTGPSLRRMSAEQVWDSFLTLMTSELDRPDERREKRYHLELARTRRLIESLNAQAPDQLVSLAQALDEIAEKNADELKKLRDEQAVAREAKDKAKLIETGKRQNDLRQEMETAAFRIIGEKTGISFDKKDLMVVADAAAAEEMAAFDEISAPVPVAALGLDLEPDRLDSGEKPDFKNMTAAEREEWKEKRKALKKKQMQIASGEKPINPAEAKNQKQLQAAGYFRAAYMPNPAPRGHFLREFGQSDREIIEAATDDGTVPQALTLLNGPLFNYLVNPASVLSQTVMKNESPEQRIEAIYLSLLARKPTAEESATTARVLHERGPVQGLKDIVHALINTRQFLYVQ
jgi:Protein of unknown function (DUF1549)/Protein of unknown function (DUF1553)